MSDVDTGADFVFDDPHRSLTDPRRLGRLRRTGLLQVQHQPLLDGITRLAAQTTGASAAVVSLVEADRQVFPSVFATGEHQAEPRETPLSHSLCQYVVVNDAPLVVEDARSHPVLHDHAAVLEDGLVAYAGYPIRDPEGEVLGALCVIDVVPRRWEEQQLVGLEALARSVETKIALRLSRRETHLDHERLMHVLDGAANTLIIIADADGVVTMMNRTAEEMLGPGSGAYVGTWTLRDLASIATPMGPRVPADQAQDWTLRGRHGHQRVVSVRINVLRDVTGDVDGYVVVGDDVSARREAEQVLHDTIRTQAEAVRRLEELDRTRADFIATASHELRTPVTSILGYTELLSDGEVGELSPAQRNLVDRVQRNSRRLLYLVEDLLSLVRMDSGEIELVRSEVSVRSLVDRAWDCIRPSLTGRDLHVSIEVAPETKTLSGDLVQLERVLVNLLSNAVKFTPDGGAVGLAVSESLDAVVFEVTDTGIGIDAAEQVEVFEPFFRTTQAQQQAIPGSGVGLAVVRRIVEAHGGRVSLASTAGCGTTVTLTIPLLRCSAA